MQTDIQTDTQTGERDGGVRRWGRGGNGGGQTECPSGCFCGHLFTIPRGSAPATIRQIFAISDRESGLETVLRCRLLPIRGHEDKGQQRASPLQIIFPFKNIPHCRGTAAGPRVQSTGSAPRFFCYLVDMAERGGWYVSSLTSFYLGGAYWSCYCP